MLQMLRKHIIICFVHCSSNRFVKAKVAEDLMESDIENHIFGTKVRERRWVNFR